MSPRKPSRATAIVVDASVLNKTVIHENESDDVTAALAHAARGNVPLVVLPLTRYEVGNVLVKAAKHARSKPSPGEIEALMMHALALVAEETESGAAEIAIRHALSFYDASYLALTLAKEGSRLWTFDTKLGKAADAENRRILTDEILRL